MATPLPDLSDYDLNVTPYQGLREISRVFGAGAGFGGADYIAARKAGYSDDQIANFLQNNSYLLNPDAVKTKTDPLSRIKAGQQDQLIAAGLPNLSKSDINRAAIVNPNPVDSKGVPYADYTVAGRGGAPSVQMSNANVNVAGNDSYNQLMNASQSGSLLMVKNPPQNNLFGQSYDPGTYKLINSYTGDVVANNVSPSQTKGVYQFNFANPQSEGSVNAYIRADPTTGAVGAIDPSKNLSYQSGMGGGMLSGIAGMALPVLAGLALPGIGEYLGSALSGFTEADTLANLATFAPAGSSVITAEGAIPAAYSAAGTAAAAAPSLYSQAADLYHTVTNNPIVQDLKTANQAVNTVKAAQNDNPAGVASGLLGLGSSLSGKTPTIGATGGDPNPADNINMAQNGSTGTPTFTTDGSQAGTTTNYGMGDQTPTITTSAGGVSGPDVPYVPVTADNAPANLPTGINAAPNGSTTAPTFQDTSGMSQVPLGTTTNFVDNTKSTAYVDPTSGNVTSIADQQNANTPTKGTAVPGNASAGLSSLAKNLALSAGVGALASAATSGSSNGSSGPLMSMPNVNPMQLNWNYNAPATHS